MKRIRSVCSQKCFIGVHCYYIFSYRFNRQNIFCCQLGWPAVARNLFVISSWFVYFADMENFEQIWFNGREHIFDHNQFFNIQVRFEYLKLLMLRRIFRYNKKFFKRVSVGKSNGNTDQQMLVTGKKSQLQGVLKIKLPWICGPVLVEKWNQLHLSQRDCFHINIPDTWAISPWLLYCYKNMFQIQEIVYEERWIRQIRISVVVS